MKIHTKKVLNVGLFLLATLFLGIGSAEEEVRQIETATVMQHHKGKGKYDGMLGSITVRNEKHGVFKISVGFSMDERRNPPPISSVIEYKHKGFSSKGKPRYVSFVDTLNTATESD